MTPRRDCETEANPAGSAIACFRDAIKGLENAFEIPLRNAATAVADGHDRIIAIETGTNVHFASRRGEPDRIAYDIVDGEAE